MKSFLMLGIAAASIAAVPALSQPRGGGDGITRAEVQSRIAAMFAGADTNRDGFITQAEAQALRETARTRRGGGADGGQRVFARLDANGDGSISRAEFEARRSNAGDRAERRQARAARMAARGPRQGQHMGRRGMGGGFGAQAFARIDLNRDSRVSLAEATTAGLQRFDRMDVNRDGRVTREERQSVRVQRPNG